MNGWVSVHRKIWENDLLVGNPFAIAVWIWILTHADEEGNVKCGRSQIAKDTGVKAETVRYWTTRFLQQNYQLTTIKTTNKFSVFHICKWDEYQNKTTSTSTATLQQNYSKTTTNNNNKDNNTSSNEEDTTYIGKSPSASSTRGKPEINELMAYWQQMMGYGIKSRLLKNRYAASNLLKVHGLEAVRTLVRVAAAARADEYAPRAADFCDLQAKVNQLILWAQKQEAKVQKNQITNLDEVK